METQPAPREQPHPVLGRIVVTLLARAVVTDADVRNALGLHLATHRDKFIPQGPGEASAGVQLLSSHRTQDGEKFWVLTDSVRRVTTLLLPSEY